MNLDDFDFLIGRVQFMLGPVSQRERIEAWLKVERAKVEAREAAREPRPISDRLDI